MTDLSCSVLLLLIVILLEKEATSVELEIAMSLLVELLGDDRGNASDSHPPASCIARECTPGIVLYVVLIDHLMLREVIDAGETRP